MRDGEGWWLPMGPRTSLVAKLAAPSARAHDLVLGAKSTRREQWSVVLPSGFEVESIARDANVSSDFGSFTMKVTQQGATVRVDTTLVITAARVTPSQYPRWRVFCQAVDAASSPRVLAAPK